jgi:flagellar P-ring protein FlgI
MKKAWAFATVLLLVAVAAASGADTPPREARIGDISSVEGIRSNPVMGYGLVVGLNGTGDQQQDIFPIQTLTNILQKMGIQTPGGVITRNIASVFVTAMLPPFAHPGTRIDVNVASTGDAKSLQGGMLLMTPLYGADGKVYAVSQGSLVIGGYTAGANGTTVTVNHPTSGRIPGGAIVESETSVNISNLKDIYLLLHQADFDTAENTATAINQAFGKSIAQVVDSRSIHVVVPSGQPDEVPALLAKIESTPVLVHVPARVVVDEKTGTVVLGRSVTLSACSIMHGNLAVQITTELQVSQPQALSSGQTAVVPQTTVRTQETKANRVELHQGATVQDLVNGLQAIGATSRDIIAILEGLKSAGALQADLEVI